MFSEKNISKYIILTPIITVILIAFFTSYFFIQTQNSYFKEESIRIEKKYLIKQKNILKKEINSVIHYINYNVLENKNLNETLLNNEILKSKILKYIETIRYEKHGYIWIHDTSYFLLAHPFRQKSIGKYDINLEDAKGVKITKKFINETIKNPNGIFIKYYWQKPNLAYSSEKLGFFKLYDKFSWVIGAGLYIDDIQSSILKNKKLLEQRINKYIRFVVIVSFLVILSIGILSFIVSNRVNRVFNKYKQNVIKKEFLLEDLNQNLEKRVLNAILEVQSKDRAMLHQSRLARMGVMLSMIAHQWRQPLSKISAILMELETATKFNKSNDKLVLQTIDTSNKLLVYMSNTIDDFRNFFKPDKEKIYFNINDAISEAFSLIEASILNLNIDFEETIITNSKIYGYKREFAQVILNLLSNAKDALEQNNIQNPKITLSTEEINNNVIISISDNAKGINDDIIHHIFEPYFTTKDSFKGTGLGLYMSKIIIEKNMQGKLNVINEKDGAKFTICLKAKYE